jgi:cyclophilin family peptidyl-prolyl cis-trans isomerase
MTAAGALVLAGCGSSGSGASTAHASARKASTTSASASEQAASGSQSAESAACRTVPAPISKAGERAHKPTHELDPVRRYVVRLATNCGTIGIELDVKQAPKTTSSFASLVQRGFYDDLTFHRIVPGFVIQGGDPDGNGTGGPGYQVVEAPPHDLQYTRGVVAMAKTEADPSGASGSQFFIVTAQNANLPADYALVGRVVVGEDAVDAISKASKEGPDAEHSTPRMPIVIEKATLERI